MSILPLVAKLSRFQKEEYAKVWFDLLGKLSIASLVIKLFEPSGIEVALNNLIILVFGLIIFILCVRVGLLIAGAKKI